MKGRIDPANIDRLLRKLGYSPDTGYVPSTGFADLPSHRFAISQAQAHMSVFGFFGLRLSASLDTRTPRLAPLVYLAEALDDDQAREVHKKVWSQGLVPFLLVLVPSGIWICRGFSYSTTDWRDKCATYLTWEQAKASPLLDRYQSKRLRSSLAWRDFALNPKERVDVRLLDNLEILSKIFIEGRGGYAKLPPRVANALIGRFLYVYFLLDRGIITQAWIDKRGHGSVSLNDPISGWPLGATWAFFEDLDEIFNGSIFPIDDVDRRLIRTNHITFLRNAMRHGTVTEDGVQLSFFDFSFAAIRTETLSAVYERFLENQGEDEKKASGAFYTPPFLVDFVLECLEDLVTFEEGFSVLDSAAGSGIFLVGSYRRIIENELARQRCSFLPAARLRQILLASIFGIEKNSDACHVAAFSLYLTLLDYTDAKDFESILSGEVGCKLFPSLVGKNIVSRDFFSPEALPKGFPDRFDCIVGNPPWQKTTDAGGVGKENFARSFQVNHSDSMPIDQNRLGELFAWKCAKQHLRPGGHMGILLSAHSFLSPSSKNFPVRFAKEFRIAGATNLSHFRYRLFPSAKHPAVALFVVNDRPSEENSIWVYSPLWPSQPIDRKGYPWVIVPDRAEIRAYPYKKVALQQRGWFEAFMLRPVDRRLAEYFRDFCAVGKGSTLGEVWARFGLACGRGGSPAQTHLESAHILSGDERDVNYYRIRLGLDSLSHLTSLAPTYRLTKRLMADLPKAFSAKFGGCIILIPRSFKYVDYIEQPVAFNSSLNAIYFNKIGAKHASVEGQFLRALAKFLGSDFVQYAIALVGSLWLLDGRRLEKNDLAFVPTPFKSLEDDVVAQILSASKPDLEQFLMEIFGITGDFRRVINEYNNWREGFQDGKVPRGATAPPSRKYLSDYKSVLERRLNSLTGSRDDFYIEIHQDDERSLGLIQAALTDSRSVHETRSGWDSNRREFLEKYDNGMNTFSNSLLIVSHDKGGQVQAAKPLQAFHWTIERAFADSVELVRAMTSSNQVSTAF